MNAFHAFVCAPLCRITLVWVLAAVLCGAARTETGTIDPADCPPGADWRQTDPEADGTWSITFSLPLPEMAEGAGEAMVLRLEPADKGNR